MSKFKIWRLKRKAKRLYTRYISHYQSFPCGQNLGQYISLDPRSIAAEFNQVMETLEKIDPDCPQLCRIEIEG